MAAIEQALRDDGLEASVQLFSGASGDGVQAAWSVLDRWFELEATGEAAAGA